MEYDSFETSDGLTINVAKNTDYRTCSVCGGDCVPEAGGADGHGVRVMFVCPEHGPQSVVDPFENERQQPET